MKKYLLITVMLLFNISFLNQKVVFSSVLKNFKQDFAKNTAENNDDQTNGKQDENQKAADETNSAEQDIQPVIFSPITIAEANSNNDLDKFYNDFKPPKKEPADNNQQPPTNQNTYNYYYRDYPLDYYRYNYPYYYPYYDFYPRETVVIQQEQNVQPNQLRSLGPERYIWYNASLDYQSVSKDLTSVGMILSLISAGKIYETSWGLKFDYNLYTEKQEDGSHVSLPLYNLGLVIGKQMGKGLVESFISYAKLGDFSGLSLKLSSDQWIHKYLFVTGGVGVSIINDSPLTDTNIGLGAGNSMLQFIVGYRSPTSVNYSLAGPEFKIRLIM